ncbi:putative mitochondrial protein AtMg00240 [Castanea sativa]|uniref:putative mitochondrial protein AtMg00240 n=1 Tax=Castanea sativa TaxID=21020 RepID=UPI003F652747
MAANAKLTNDPLGESVDHTLYRSMIGCLLYLTASRPDIAFSVGVCSRLHLNPKVSHLNAVKRIIKYVSGTCDYGLFYRKESNLSLGFSDSDWAGNADEAPLVGVFMDLVERKIVVLEYIPTECQNADIFTKPLDRSKFETLHQVIGVILCP